MKLPLASAVGEVSPSVEGVIALELDVGSGDRRDVIIRQHLPVMVPVMPGSGDSVLRPSAGATKF